MSRALGPDEGRSEPVGAVTTTCRAADPDDRPAQADPASAGGRSVGGAHSGAWSVGRALPRLSVALAVLARGRVSPRTAGAARRTEFPKGWEGFHSYTELTTEIANVAAAHPDIVKVFSIGKSYKGRELWAVKVSDNVGVDETEPEVLFDGSHHSDEHMGVEMTLHIFHWLVDGYGVGPADHEHRQQPRDLHRLPGQPRRGRVRHPRRPLLVLAEEPPADAGLDGDRDRPQSQLRLPAGASGGRTSANPLAITYHGPRPFSSPETRAMRDFLASRVVNGRQQIRMAISFHELGRLVMWPYGYTQKTSPPT